MHLARLRAHLRLFIGAVMALALVVAGATTWWLSREGGPEAARAMSEALEKNPSLASHRLPLAYVAEKLEQQGGEASGEILNGPAQESYDQRAYPHAYVRHAQASNAKAAFATAHGRSTTASGRQLLRRAQGTARVQTWHPLGPDGGLQVPESTYTGSPAVVSGRTTALALDGSCTTGRCVLYAGTAGGGVWKSTDAMAATPTWTSIGSDIPSTAIGSLLVTGDGTLYVGTGEPNGSSDSEAGVGLYRSTDAGSSFTKVPTAADGQDFALNRSVASIAVDPADPQHLVVGTAVARHGSSSVNGGRFTPPGSAKVGLYESTDGGSTWSLSLSEESDAVNPASPTGADYFRGGVSKILFDPTHRGTVFASMFDYGLFRRTGNGSWKQVYTIKTPGSPATTLSNRVEFDLATLPGGETRVYLGDSTYFDNQTAALLRSDDGTATDPSFTLLSDPTPGTPGYGSYNFCQGQCSYDMAVTAVPHQPDQVFLSGSMNYDELQAFGGPGSSNGRAVVRSTDAGVHVTDMTNDAVRPVNGLHPDQHALVVTSTRGRQVVFTGSDGGVVRGNGPYRNRSAECARRGLSGAELSDCRQYLSAIPSQQHVPQPGPADAAVPERLGEPQREQGAGRHPGQRHLGVGLPGQPVRRDRGR